MGFASVGGLAGCLGGGGPGGSTGGSDGSSWQDVFEVREIRVEGEYADSREQTQVANVYGEIENISENEISHATVHIGVYPYEEKENMLGVLKPEFYNWSPGQVAQFEERSGQLETWPQYGSVLTIEYTFK